MITRDKPEPDDTEEDGEAEVAGLPGRLESHGSAAGVKGGEARSSKENLSKKAPC